MLDTTKIFGTSQTLERTLQEDIHRLIEKIPVDSLKMLKQFALFLNQQVLPSSESILSDEPKQLKIVTVPVSQVLKLAGALPSGYEGNALLDTEKYFEDI